MSRDIQELRVEIDHIDRQIVELLKQRLSTANEVAEYKRERDLPVLDAGRERALLAKIAEQSGEEFEPYIQSIYHTMLSSSRSYQSVKLERQADIYRGIQTALEETPRLFPQRCKVACQGVEGAYAQIACSHLFKAPEISYYHSFEHVFQAVDSGECQYGVLPIENSTAGSVHAVYDLMQKYNFYIVRSARMKISHNLLTKRGGRLEEIREVISHEQAIHQCAGYLTKLGVKVTVVPNTAVAAQMVAQSERTDLAALSSRFCAQLYHLDILQESVQDRDNNYTRFICISKQQEIYPGADRTSLMLTLPHQPGALSTVLSKFSGLGINVQKLESRPLPGREFEFMFYFDIEESVYSPQMALLFRMLEVDCERLRYLGTYHEVIC